MSKEALKENANHGTEDFPLAVYLTNYTYDHGNVLYYHWHKEFEFILIKKGAAIFQINDEEIVVNTGESIFINSNFIHAARSLDNQCCSFYAIVFSSNIISNHYYGEIYESYIQPIIDETYIFPKPFSPSISSHKDILKLLNEIISLSEDNFEDNKLFIKGKLLESWHLCNKISYININHSKIPNYKTERLKIVCDYIHNNYHEKVSLQELADLIHLNKSHFCRFFKEATNLSPMSYINKYRIHRSCLLIKHTDKKMAEISSTVGFDNISYFNRVFLDVMGCTPSNYKYNYKRTVSKL